MGLVSWMNSMAGRSTRTGAGIALIALGAALGGISGFAIAVVGLVPLAAGLAGVCILAPALHASPRQR